MLRGIRILDSTTKCIKYKTALDANTNANMYKYKIQNSRYANGRWMSPIWGRNSFVGITKDFLTTMKTCKSGNSTKMFCPQMEDIRPQIMLYFENIIDLYSWVVDMLACLFVYIFVVVEDSSKMVKSFIWFSNLELVAKVTALAALELYIWSVSIGYLGAVYLGWYLVFVIWCICQRWWKVFIGFANPEDWQQ